MTESEWLGCDDPGFMLDYIEKKVSDRKLRLFAVACCRRVWHLLSDERSRTAAEVTEEFVDGHVSALEFETAGKEAWQADENHETVEPTPATVAALIIFYPPFDAAYTCGSISVLVDRESMPKHLDWWTTHEKEGEVEARNQTDLLRCIVGNPFKPSTIGSIYLVPTAIILAASAYDERSLPSGHLDPERLAVLSDALEEAGCDDADILNHLRSSGPHVRGCWVVDLLLGKA